MEKHVPHFHETTFHCNAFWEMPVYTWEICIPAVVVRRCGRTERQRPRPPGADVGEPAGETGLSVLLKVKWFILALGKQGVCKCLCKFKKLLGVIL